MSDPETRVGALFAVQGRGARGRVRWRVADELRAGNTLLRNLATAGGEYATGATSAVSVDLEADLRRDTSFDLRRSDARLGGVAAGRLFAADRSASVRAFGRVERVRDGEDGEPLFPDFDWWQAGVDADRHGRAGSLALNYAYGERAFPDTAARDYREHDAGLTVFLRAGPRLGLDAWGGVARRLAWDEAAVGDRLWQGDVEGRATWRAGEATELGVRARLRFATYDAPTPTFFDGRFWRWAAFVRFPGALTVELRPEVEFARTPDFGGLPPEATDDDRRAVAGEEFDEIALHADLERFAAGAWWTLAPAVGKRDYLDAATDALDLSARSDFWYVELFGFAEKRFPGWTLRATGDVRWEEHAIATDDARSLSVAAELRVPLR